MEEEMLFFLTENCATCLVIEAEGTCVARDHCVAHFKRVLALDPQLTKELATVLRATPSLTKGSSDAEVAGLLQTAAKRDQGLGLRLSAAFKALLPSKETTEEIAEALAITIIKELLMRGLAASLKDDLLSY